MNIKAPVHTLIIAPLDGKYIIKTIVIEEEEYERTIKFRKCKFDNDANNTSNSPVVNSYTYSYDLFKEGNATIVRGYNTKQVKT